MLSVSCEPVPAADLRRIQGIYREQGAVRAVGRRFPRRHPCILSGLGPVSLFPKTGKPLNPKQGTVLQEQGTRRRLQGRAVPRQRNPGEVHVVGIFPWFAKKQRRRESVALRKRLRKEAMPDAVVYPGLGVDLVHGGYAFPVAGRRRRLADRSSRGRSRGSRPSCEDNAIVRLSRTRRRVSLNADPRSAGAPLRR